MSKTAAALRLARKYAEGGEVEDVDSYVQRSPTRIVVTPPPKEEPPISDMGPMPYYPDSAPYLPREREIDPEEMAALPGIRERQELPLEPLHTKMAQDWKDSFDPFVKDEQGVYEADKPIPHDGSKGKVPQITQDPRIWGTLAAADIATSLPIGGAGALKAGAMAGMGAKLKSAFSSPISKAVTDVSKWKQIGPQGGSNPGGLFMDPATKQEWYIKTPKSVEHLGNEILAAKLYELAGVSVPEIKPVFQNGKAAVASKIIPGQKLSNYNQSSKGIGGLRDNLPVDAWLGNRDVIGLEYDNIIVDAAGKAHRIDTGGALRYRAQGMPKDFGPDVLELKGLIDPNINEQAASVFSGQIKGINDTLHRLNNIPEKKIKELVDIWGPQNPVEKKKLYENLLARRQKVIEHFLTQRAMMDQRKTAADGFKPAKGGPHGKGAGATASQLMDDFMGDPEAIGIAIFEMAEKDYKFADQVTLALPRSIQQEVDEFLGMYAQQTGKNPFIEGKSLDVAASGNGAGLDQAPWTNIGNTVLGHLEDGYSPSVIAGSIWEAASAGDMAAAKAAKEALPDKIKTQVNKELWKIKNNAKDHVFANAVAGHLFKNKPGKANVSEFVPKNPLKDKKSSIFTKEEEEALADLAAESKPYSDDLKKVLDEIASEDEGWLAKQAENDAKFSEAHHHASNSHYFNGWNSDQVAQHFKKTAKEIDWKSYKPKSDVPIKTAVPEKVSKKHVEQLGFNTNFQLHKGGHGTYDEIPDPVHKPYEKGWFVADEAKVAKSYGSITSYVARAPKALEVDWKKLTGGHSYIGSALDKTINEARKTGADLLIVHNMNDMGKAFQTQYIFLNNKGTLRALNAKFDPEKLHLAHPLAGIAGIIGGGSFVYGNLDRGEKMKRGGAVNGKRLEGALRLAKKYASGGPLKDIPGLGDPDKHVPLHSGLLNSTIPGRTDKLPVAVKPGSYILPADILSSTKLGEGNTMAGAKTMDHLLAPHRESVRKGIYKGLGRNSRKSVKARLKKGYAEGGAADKIPIIVAGGEYAIEPEAIESIGGGDMNKGHNSLDSFVKRVRRHNIKTLKALPPPKRN